MSPAPPTQLTGADLDVAIVGAGISGLTVARLLGNAGRSVRIFEARGRSGGRVLSTPVPGGYADLGPTWFWPGEPRVLALISEFDLPMHQQYAQGDAILAAQGHVRRGGGFAVPPAFRFGNGAQSVTDALEQSLPTDTIQFDTAVERVEQHAGHVVIHTATESVTAATVVMALPPSLVIERGIVDPATLDPEVVSTAANIPVWMGGITKAVAVYDEPFWRAQGLSGMASALSESFGEIHDMCGPHGSPAMLFGFGRPTTHTVATTDVFVQQLTALFGPEAASPTMVLGCDWSNEPFTTPASGNVSQRYELFGSPALRAPSWNGALHWSSTETGAVAPGHLEGAMEAAERVAMSIMGVAT